MAASDENISRGNRLKYNALAFFTAAMWGLTFVSTKVLILNGLSPLWIFILRFIIAYLFILAIAHKELWAKSLKDELWMVVLGMTGGSVYFICENTALTYTFASNVSLIICATPVLTLFLCGLFFHQKIRFTAIIGAVMALCGVTMIILNGSLNFGLSPIGDLLTLLAALLWAIYCILVKKMNGRYSNLFITRKVFFYGFATALLFSIFEPLPTMPAAESIPAIILN
ncbi:MAG: DMT family transporter, partial [Muribaculaceae bacterium]|nr:DMT family transporter [Muribaculaceae bacterium]